MDYLSAIDPQISEQNSAHLSHWTAHSRVDTSDSFSESNFSLEAQLQTTLNIADLLSIFLNHLASSFKISAVQFRSESLVFERTSKINSLGGKHLHTVLLQQKNETLGELTYTTNRPLSPLMLSSLSEQQNKLFYPIKNGLAYHRLQQIAMKDMLTGADNRVSYQENMGRALQLAQRHARPFVLMLLDLDNFKQVNDQFGHQRGDQVLKIFAKLVQNCLRGTDRLFRFGGDEFAIILDQDILQDAESVANRLSKELSQSLLGIRYKVGVSIGLSVYQSNDNSETIFARADKALYDAKHAGKNCFRVA